MSSGSSLIDSYLVDGRIQGPPLPCFCPGPAKPAKEHESRKKDNPGQRFYNCAMSLVSEDSCRFFDWNWIDPPLSKHYRDIIWKLKGEIEDLANTPLVNRYEKKIENEKALRAADNELASKRINELELQVELLKKKIKKQFVMFMVGLLVLFVVMKVMV